MTPNEIRSEVVRLPSGIYTPAAKAAIGYLMLAESLTLDEAAIRFDELVSSPQGDAMVRAALRAKKGQAR